MKKNVMDITKKSARFNDLVNLDHPFLYQRVLLYALQKAKTEAQNLFKTSQAGSSPLSAVNDLSH